MAERKRKATSSKTSAAKTTARKKSVASAAGIALPQWQGLTLSSLRPNKGSRPKRTRVGRGHGSGLVKTGGEGGKGQTVRSGGGKGPSFEGGQTPWQRRLPHRRGYSQKARDTGHFRVRYAVVNLRDLAGWDASVEVTPQTLKAAKKIRDELDGVKILGATGGKALPSGLRFRDVVFSNAARVALEAAQAVVDAQ